MIWYFCLILISMCTPINTTSHSHYHHITARAETNSFSSLTTILLSNEKKGLFEVSTSYGKNYNSSQMAKTLLNAELIEISGSQNQTRNSNALVADYFGLSDAFHSNVKIKPTIHTWHTTLNGQYTFSDQWTALFTVSLGINSHHLNLTEQIADDSQNNPYQQGIMNFNTLNPNPPFTSFISASESLKQASFLNKKKSGFLQSKIQIKKRWWHTDESWGQWGIHLLIPSKEDKECITFFEPSKGTNHHWGIGLSCEGSKKMWSNFEHFIAINGIIETSYLFKRKTKRTFDLKCNGFLSRYLLLKEFENGTVKNLVEGSTILTRKCTVSLPFVFDGTLLCTYQNNNFIIGLGYNGFIRSTEKISSIQSIEKNRFGIKGLTPLVDQLSNEKNNATQSKATMFTTQNATDNTTTYLTTDDLDKKSAATSLSVIHALCSCIMYKTNTEKNEIFIGLTAMIELQGLEEQFNSITTESDPTLFRFGLTGGFIF